jgi:pyruvate kinase
MARRTKIVATLGPATDRPGVLDEVIGAGVDVVRLNLSHGELEEHRARMHAVRAVAERVNRPVAILADLPGPKVRTGGFPESGVFLADGAVVRLTAGDGTGSPDDIYIDYPPLVEELRPGDAVILGDGAITLRVERVERDAAMADARVVSGGLVQGRPGVHILSERMRLQAPTDHDLELLHWLTTDGADVDFVAVSFVRSAADVKLVKEQAGPAAPRVMAKIETTAAVTDIDEILCVADAVMVARGDLGIECPLEDVPHIQKQIIRACVEAGVPVITATQMLESMITSPAPTRAEVSDVANAVFDGTDALMLSGETAIGHDPARVVRTMGRIAERAEADAPYRQWGEHLGRTLGPSGNDAEARITHAITHAAWQAAADGAASAIVCCTIGGLTARAMARFRPEAKLIGLSPNARTVRAIALSWGVIPMKFDTYRSTDEMVRSAIDAVVGAGHVTPGDLVAVLAGAPDLSGGGATDVLRIVRIG